MSCGFDDSGRRQYRGALLAALVAVAARADVLTWTPLCEAQWKACCDCDGGMRCGNWGLAPVGSPACPAMPTALDHVAIGSDCVLADLDETGGGAVDVLTQTSGVFSLQTSLAIGTQATFDGPFEWYAGDLGRTAGPSQTITNGPLTLFGFGGMSIGASGGHTLTCNGFGLWSGGALTIGGGSGPTPASSLVIGPEGSLDIQSDGSILGTTTLGTLRNEGLIRKLGTGGTTALQANLINTSYMDVKTGTVRLFAGENCDVINVDGGAGLEFASGSLFRFRSGSTFEGAGSARVAGADTTAEVVLDGPIPWTNLDLTVGGDISGAGELLLGERMVWRGGRLGADALIDPGAILQIDQGPISELVGGPGTLLRLRGTASITPPGTLSLLGAMSVEPGGQLNLVLDGSISGGAASPGLTVLGRMVKPTGIGLSVLDVPFQLVGTAEVHTGTLVLPRPWTLSGLLDIRGGAIVALTSGTPAQILPGAMMIGDGTLRIATPSTTTTAIQNPAGITPGRVELNSGRVTGPGPLHIQRGLQWSGGVIDAGATVTTAVGSTSLIRGAGPKPLEQGATFINRGTMEWSDAGPIRFDGNPSTLVNAAGATITARGDTNATGAPTGVIDNQGTFRRSEAGTTTLTDVVLASGGTIELESGALRFQRSSGAPSLQTSGTILALSSVTLSFDNATMVFNPGSRFIGNGRIALDGPSAQVFVNEPAGIDIGTLSMTDGQVRAPSPLRIATRLDWSGGSVTTGSRLRVSFGGDGQILGPAQKKITFNSALEIEGRLEWLGTGEILVEDRQSRISTLAGGRLTATGDTLARSVDAGRFLNAGELRKSGGGTSILRDLPLTNSGIVRINSGVLQIDGTVDGTLYRQTTGTTHLNGGSLHSDTDLQLDGGIVLGAGTITADVQNAGATVEPGNSAAGLLGVARDLTAFPPIFGHYTQGAAGRLRIEVGGTTPILQHDQLQVAGTVALGGELRIVPIGGYVPQVGHSYTVVTCGARIGVFSSVVGAGSFNVNYGTTSITVTCTRPHCPGDTDFDRDIDLADVARLLINFGTSGGASIEEGDVNGDGRVNLTDLALMLQRFGVVNCP